MRIVDVRDRSVAISRYRDATIPSSGLTTSIVAVVTDVVRAGRPVVGWGFASVGRFAQPRAVRPPPARRRGPRDRGGERARPDAGLARDDGGRALGLGGAEMNPLAFGPFGGLADGIAPAKGRVAPPEAPGIGFEEKADLARLFRTLDD
jgi:hypothetical protein